MAQLNYLVKVQQQEDYDGDKYFGIGLSFADSRYSSFGIFQNVVVTANSANPGSWIFNSLQDAIDAVVNGYDDTILSDLNTRTNSSHTKGTVISFEQSVQDELDAIKGRLDVLENP